MKKRNHHLREMPSHVFAESRLTDDFHVFMQKRILPWLEFVGYKLDAKRSIATHCVHNLITCGLTGHCIADTRDSSQSGVRLRLQVWDAIEKAGLARVAIGSELSGRTTRYRATNRLLALRKIWKLRLLVDLNLARNTEMMKPTPFGLVYLHSGKLDPSTGDILPKELRKQPLNIKRYIELHAQPGSDGKSDLQAIENGLNYFRSMEDTIERINLMNVSHSWMASDEFGHVFQPNVCLRQFHIGKAFRATRLYSWGHLSGQNLSKVIRRKMQIDNEPVSEFDYSGMFLRLAYHMKGIDPDPTKDIYAPEKLFPKTYSFKNTTKVKKAILRDFVKLATTICFNVSSPGLAKSSIGKMYVDHEHRLTLQNAMKMEELSPGDVPARLLEVHPLLVDHFFTSNGMDLMTVESKIMIQILVEFTDANKPILAIHDGLVCRASDGTFAQETMTESYRKVIGFHPVIKQSF